MYTETQLDALIAKIETEFNSSLAKAEKIVTEDLKKSETIEKNEECDYDANDYEDMHKMYDSMSKGEKDAHYKAIQKVMGTEMTKSEKDIVVKIDEDSLKKMEALEKENQGLRTNIDNLAKVLEKLVVNKPAPKQKAITNIEVVRKDGETLSKSERNFESMSKSEITKILSKKATDPTLKQEDRDAIRSYYIENNNINSVKHLL